MRYIAILASLLFSGTAIAQSNNSPSYERMVDCNAEALLYGSYLKNMRNQGESIDFDEVQKWDRISSAWSVLTIKMANDVGIPLSELEGEINRAAASKSPPRGQLEAGGVMVLKRYVSMMRARVSECYEEIGQARTEQGYKGFIEMRENRQ